MITLERSQDLFSVIHVLRLILNVTNFYAISTLKYVEVRRMKQLA